MKTIKKFDEFFKIYFLAKMRLIIMEKLLNIEQNSTEDTKRWSPGFWVRSFRPKDTSILTLLLVT